MTDQDKPKQFKDEKLKEMERKGEIKFEVVTNDATDRSLILLTGAKNIFQKQLPKMSKEYITRLVYDKKHATLLITKNGNAFQAIGAITYRAFVEKRFVEIVFCAISSDEQVQVSELNEQFANFSFLFYLHSIGILIFFDESIERTRKNSWRCYLFFDLCR